MGEHIVGAIKRYFPVAIPKDTAETKLRRYVAAVASHSKAVIAAHWSTVVMIVISVIAVYCRDLTEDKALRVFLLELHRQLGLLILIVVPLRVAFRQWLGFVDYGTPMHFILRWARNATHLALYAGLVITPILGWASTNAHRISVKLLGALPLPNLVAPDADLADMLTDYHTWTFYALAAAVAQHACAALFHHFVLRDGILMAMLGGCGGRKRMQSAK